MRLLISTVQSVLFAWILYLPERRTLCLAGGARGRVVRIVKGLVTRVHGDLVLPIEAVVPQLRHPLIEQLLRFHLKRQSDRNQGEDESKSVQGEETPAILLLFKSF